MVFLITNIIEFFLCESNTPGSESYPIRLYLLLQFDVPQAIPGRVWKPSIIDNETALQVMAGQFLSRG
jgi:hypothetical protein